MSKLSDNPRDYYLPPERLQQLTRLMIDVHIVLEEAGFQYWIDGGTLLAAVRHRAIPLPWDDDADIAMPVRWYKKLRKLYPRFSERGYLIDEKHIDQMIKVYLPVPGLWNKKKSVGAPTLDIFPFKESDDEWRITPQGSLRRWPACRHKTTDLFPLRLYQVNGFKVWGPKNPMPYLYNMYPTWDTEFVIELRDMDPNDSSKTSKTRLHRIPISKVITLKSNDRPTIDNTTSSSGVTRSGESSPQNDTSPKPLH